MNRTLVIAVALLLSTLAADTAQAINTYDTRVFIPIIGRFAGAGGTLWRTDVFVSNMSSVDKDVDLIFYVSGGTTLTRRVPMPQFTSASFSDIVLTTFGLENASGQLEVRSSNESGLEARARIYNTGNPAGQFGQSVPGLGLVYLRRQALISGLSGVNGNRVNVGVANASSDTIPVTITVTGKTGNLLRNESTTLGPYQVVQYNDIFTRFGITPQADVSVNINTTEASSAIYGYASEVRNDTGDAIFIFGTSPHV